jgi:Zinc dependent phospholipase C
MPNLVAGLVLMSLLVPSSASAWGFETHKYIVSRAIDVLPAEIRPFFQANRTFIVEHCVDPDLWRVAGFADEPPRHFVDIDAYGTYPFAELPRDYNAALAKYGRETLTKNGLLPWRTAEMAGQLAKMFQQIPQNVGYAAGDVTFFAAVIGHYVADAHVPFHAVMNYDGQLTGQNGIHVRFEEDLFVRYRSKLTIQPPPLHSIPNARDLIFDTLLESYTLADKVLAADREAIGESPVYDDRYYDAFFAKVKPILEKRLGDSISAVASVIASEWERAARPALPVNPPKRPPAPRRRSATTP